MAIPKLNDYALPTADELPQNKVTWQVEPQRAALLIHDMQQYFLNFWGEDSALIKQVVENIANLRRYCKQQGIPVFYTAQPNHSVGSGERQRMMAKPVLCDTCQGLRCRCCGVLQD
jgi:bifunctional isochorismate lyase/aryl carrier protein